MRLRRRLSALVLVTLVAACGLSVTGIDPEADDARPATPGVDGGDVASPDAASTGRDGAIISPTMDADADADANIPVPTSLFGEECPAGTVYDDDFSTDPANRWLVIAGLWEWSASEHTYALKPPVEDVGVAWIGPRPKWTNYDVDVTEKVSLPPSDHGDVGPIFRVGAIPKKDPQPANDGDMFLAAAQVNTGANLILAKFNNGGYTQLNQNNNGYDTTTTLTVHAKIAGASLKAWLNNDSANSITATDTTYAAGSIGIRAYKSPVVLSRVKVTCR